MMPPPCAKPCALAASAANGRRQCKIVEVDETYIGREEGAASRTSAVAVAKAAPGAKSRSDACGARRSGP